MLTRVKECVSVFSWGNTGRQWSSVVKRGVRLVDKNSIHPLWLILCELHWAKGFPDSW